jgi:hypothetical protein
MKDKHFYWEIPSSIDLEAFLQKYPPKFKYSIDKFYYIIEYLCRGMDLEDLDETAGFINLNAKILQSKIHDYKQYLTHLTDKGFIRTDMKYIVGEKSTGYLVNKYSYHRATVRLIPIQTFVIKKNRTVDYQKHEASLKAMAIQYPFLTKWFNKGLQIDVEEALKKVEELFPEQTGGIKGTKKGEPSIWHKRYKAILAINKIANQEFYYKVDDNVGRFHSNLTNIKRELRSYLTYDGQKLVNIDIKNSQPLFSLLLLNKDFYEQKEGQFTIYNIPSSLQLLSNTTHSYFTTLTMIVKTLESFVTKDIETYSEMVNSGKFYQLISELIHPHKTFDKQKIKEMVFTVFFSNNRFIGQPEAKPKNDFKKAFPSVYEVFKQLKVKNHTTLAHILQRIESEIVIQRVAKRISVERPELPIFTIHDSVATTQGNEDYVSTVIKEEILKLTGLIVQLGIERWSMIYK